VQFHLPCFAVDHGIIISSELQRMTALVHFELRCQGLARDSNCTRRTFEPAFAFDYARQAGVFCQLCAGHSERASGGDLTFGPPERAGFTLHFERCPSRMRRLHPRADACWAVPI
jgi:hypothetical protein